MTKKWKQQKKKILTVNEKKGVSEEINKEKYLNKIIKGTIRKKENKREGKYDE